MEMVDVQVMSACALLLCETEKLCHLAIILYCIKAEQSLSGLGLGALSLILSHKYRVWTQPINDLIKSSLWMPAEL